MEDEYFYYYLLSYFKKEKEVKASQILHVLKGKKTPSMYYLTEINQWHHGFSLAKRIEKKQIEAIITKAFRENRLVKTETGYLLTELGQKSIENYFKNHYYPSTVHSFQSIDLYEPFWNRIQLFSQVFSEYSYQNNMYTAIIKNPQEQEQVRLLFQASQGKIELVLEQWVREQKFIFKKISEAQANLLANTLTGHQIIGKTRNQLSAELQMTALELKFYLRDAIEEVISVIKSHREELALTAEILEQTQLDYYYSMSKSTYRTYKMLKKGINISEIARKRKIKENTIKEHILEIAFVLSDFPTEHFVPAKIYQLLLKKFRNSEKYSYREAMADQKGLEFYHYRLVELERMREY